MYAGGVYPLMLYGGGGVYPQCCCRTWGGFTPPAMYRYMCQGSGFGPPPMVWSGFLRQGRGWLRSLHHVDPEVPRRVSDELGRRMNVHWEPKKSLQEREVRPCQTSWLKANRLSSRYSGGALGRTCLLKLRALL